MRLAIPIVPLLRAGGHRGGQRRRVRAGGAAAPAVAAAWLAAVMVLDVLLFSGLLYFTGGPVNPFSFLYLIPIALASS